MKSALLLLLLCAAVAHAQTPPLDPWTDPAWQDVLYGLPSGQVARVSATQQLLNPLSAAGEVISTREIQFEFDAPDGRVRRLVLDEDRRGESRRQRRLRYVYEAGRLQRIDEDGQATPALTRRYDAAGRPVEQTERTGAVVARTTWRYDTAGRPAS
jgi:YD repeat-containing protein